MGNATINRLSKVQGNGQGAQGNGSQAAPAVVLRDDMEVQEAMILVAQSKVSMADYLAWDARRVARIQDAARKSAGPAGKVRVYVSTGGYVCLGGTRRKGEGFPAALMAAEVPEVAERVLEFCQVVIENAGKEIPKDATTKGYEGKGDDGKSKFQDKPHPRAGKSALWWRDEGEKRATVARCEQIVKLLTAE